MGGCRCCFRDCTVSTSQDPGMHFFHFPKNNPVRYRRWLELADKLEYLELPPSFQKNRVVCGRHFRVECFKNYKRDRLLAKPTVEPTLMPLNDNYALDYANEQENDGPELIITPKPTMKHLIPPVWYKFPFKFHDDLDAMDYIQLKGIKLGKINNYDDLLVRPISPKGQNKRKSDEVQSQKSSKKFKILNSTVISNSSAEVSEVKKTSETVLELRIEDLDDNLQNEIETILLSPSTHNYNDDSDHYDLTQMAEKITKTNDDVLVQKEYQDVSLEYENNAHYERQIEDMSVQIKKLEDDLENAKERLKLKTNILLEYEETVKKVNKDYEMLEQKYKNLDQNCKDLMEENQAFSKEIQRLREVNGNILKKFDKYEKDQDEKQDKAVSSYTMENTSSVSQSAPTNSKPNPPSKAQLFNGVKKYISSSMAALLRMEMFGSAEREWKADEKRVSLDLFQLGEDVYKYISDEWRIRLPGLGEVRNWLNDMRNSIDDEEDL